ncbi:MAG TPA: hypothetical protein VJT73_19850 [Polyangiaceae bacterium]|nr:hypothetical protein [Polyangiaceae bacterium]
MRADRATVRPLLEEGLARDHRLREVGAESAGKLVDLNGAAELVDEHVILGRGVRPIVVPRLEGTAHARVERPRARIVGLVFVERDRAALEVDVPPA